MEEINPDVKRIVEVIASPIRDEDNTILGIGCYGRDITEKEKSQQELRVAVERHKLLNEVTKDVIWDYEVATDEVKWSSNLQTAFGHQESCTPLDWWICIVHPEDRELAVNSFKQAVKEPERSWMSKYRLMHSDGHYTWVIDRGVGLLGADGKPERYIGLIQDLQDTVDAQEELEKLSLAARESSPGILTTTPDGIIEWANPAFTKMTGYDLKELLGNKPGHLLQGKRSDLDTVKRIGEAITKHEPIQVELVNYRKDGTPYWVNMAINPIFEDGRLKRFIAAASDVTKERRMNERITLQNARLKKIAFILSHDLRRPVSYILGLLQLYDKNNPAKESNNDIISYLDKATKELDDMMYEIIQESAKIED